MQMHTHCLTSLQGVVELEPSCGFSGHIEGIVLESIQPQRSSIMRTPLDWGTTEASTSPTSEYPWCCSVASVMARPRHGKGLGLAQQHATLLNQHSWVMCPGHGRFQVKATSWSRPPTLVTCPGSIGPPLVLQMALALLTPNHPS